MSIKQTEHFSMRMLSKRKQVIHRYLRNELTVVDAIVELRRLGMIDPSAYLSNARHLPEVKPEPEKCSDYCDVVRDAGQVCRHDR